MNAAQQRKPEPGIVDLLAEYSAAGADLFADGEHVAILLAIRLAAEDLEKNRAGLSSKERIKALLIVGEMHERMARDIVSARRFYEEAVAADPDGTEAAIALLRVQNLFAIDEGKAAENEAYRKRMQAEASIKEGDI